MALFFAVGGCLHLRSHTGTGGAFIARRFRRLVVPALPLLVPFGIAILAAHLTGHAALRKALVLAISPLWFLAVYLVLVLLAPAAIRWHRRSPILTVALLALAVVAIDVARFAHGWTGWPAIVAGFVVVWALVHQLGFFLDHLRAAPRWVLTTMALVGLAGLAALVSFGPYPASMVGVPGEAVSNMAPPNLAVVCLGVLQLGVLARFAASLQQFAARHARALEWSGRWSMTVYVWHLLAWGAFFLAARAIGFEVISEPTAAWWVQRPLWLAGPALIAIPLCRCAARLAPELSAQAASPATCTGSTSPVGVGDGAGSGSSTTSAPPAMVTGGAGGVASAVAASYSDGRSSQQPSANSAMSPSRRANPSVTIACSE